MKLSPEKVPNRLRATVMAHRSVAQNGQYSAPMYSTSGLPFAVSAVPVMGMSVFGLALPLFAEARVAAGTEVSLLTVLADAVPMLEPAEVLLSDLTTMSTT